MTTYRVKKQHVRNCCFKGPVKTEPSFSRIKLRVWAVVTTFYYSTSYTLLEPSGTSHDSSDENYFPEYLRIAMRLMVERILLTPPEPSPCATSACSSPGLQRGRPWAAPSTFIAGTLTLPCGCFPGPGTPPWRHFIPPPAAARLNTTSQTGCHPQAFSQLLEGVCTDTAPQLFFTADKMGKLM